MSNRFLLSGGLCTLVAAMPAHAANPVTHDVVASAQPEQAGASSSGAAAEGTANGEIVVTALRNSQTLQRTPAAVTVVSGELLQRQQVYDIRGVQNFSPAVRLSANVNSTRIYIRGIGSALDFYWIPETSALNVNGIYTPPPALFP